MRASTGFRQCDCTCFEERLFDRYNTAIEQTFLIRWESWTQLWNMIAPQLSQSLRMPSVLKAIRSGRNAQDWSESRTHIKEGGRSATRLKSTTSIMKSIATLMQILPKLELN